MPLSFQINGSPHCTNGGGGLLAGAGGGEGAPEEVSVPAPSVDDGVELLDGISSQRNGKPILTCAGGPAGKVTGGTGSSASVENICKIGKNKYIATKIYRIRLFSFVMLQSWVSQSVSTG